MPRPSFSFFFLPDFIFLLSRSPSLCSLFPLSRNLYCRVMTIEAENNTAENNTAVDNTAVENLEGCLTMDAWDVWHPCASVENVCLIDWKWDILVYRHMLEKRTKRRTGRQRAVKVIDDGRSEMDVPPHGSSFYE